MDLSDQEIECKDTIRAFWKGGVAGQQRLTLVLENIWKHYEVVDQKRRNVILKLAKDNVIQESTTDDVYQP